MRGFLRYLNGYMAQKLHMPTYLGFLVFLR